MKKEADLSGAEVTPSSSTFGCDDGAGAGSKYGRPGKLESLWVAMIID